MIYATKNKSVILHIRSIGAVQKIESSIVGGHDMLVFMSKSGHEFGRETYTNKADLEKEHIAITKAMAHCALPEAYQVEEVERKLELEQKIEAKESRSRKTSLVESE